MLDDNELKTEVSNGKRKIQNSLQKFERKWTF